MLTIDPDSELTIVEQFILQVSKEIVNNKRIKDFERRNHWYELLSTNEIHSQCIT